MSVPSRLQLTVSAEENALAAKDSYELLLAINRSVSIAPSGEAAVEALYALLRQRCGLLDLSLELANGKALHLHPDGADDEPLLADQADQATTERFVSSWLLLDDGLALGQITFRFPAAASVAPELLEATATQVALQFRLESLTRRAEEADDNARRHISEMAVIHEIGEAIDPVGLPRLLQMITEQTCLLMNAQASSLMLVGEDGRLRLAASHGLSKDVPEIGHRLGEGIAGRVAQTEQPMLIVDSGHDPRLRDVRLKPEIGSSMLVPMKDQSGKVLGVLCIRRHRPAADFTTDDLKLFSVFATQAALAIRNRRLYDDIKGRAEELLKLSTLSRTLISTVDLDLLLENVADEVRNVVNFKRCCLYMRDPVRHQFVPRVWRGYPETVGRNPVKEGDGAIGLAARSGMMLTFDSREEVTPVRARERSYRQLKGFARALGTDGFVAVPILGAHGRCAGVLVADNKGQRDPISAQQRSLLGAFVNQVGIAIDNCHYYAEMQDTLANIRRLKDYTDRVLHSIGVAILSTDGRGVIARWNPAAEETLQQPGSAFVDARLEDVLRHLRLPDAEFDHLLDLIRHVQQTGENMQRTHLTLHPKDRLSMTVYLMISRLPEHNQEPTGIVLILEDVTQEARMAAELEKMRRLADIGQLAAKMAHEVRNALSPIRGAAQIIQGDLVAQDSSTEWPDIIIAEVDGLSRLTSEMLEFARPMALAPRPLNVHEFLQAAVHSLSSFLAELQVSVECQCEVPLPELSGDPVQLGQVVRNLVMNAAQAMHGGGTLRIGCHFDRSAGWFTLEFHDTGEGIAAADLERIFRPFVTTRTKGTGLGLPIVQKIVDQHGGRVEVESELGKGTCFRVLLPLHPPQDSLERSYEEAPLISRSTAGKYPDH